MPRSANLAWLCCGPTRGAVLPTPSAEPRPHQYCGQVGGVCFSKGFWPARVNPVARIPVHVSRHGAAADGPRSTRCAVRPWCRCGAGRHVARSSPRRRPTRDRTNTATNRRRGLRTVLARAFESHGARPARVSHHGVAADRPQSTRRVARTWRGCVVSQHAARQISTPSVEARPRRYRNRSAACDLIGVSQRVRISWRVSRVRITSWSSGRQTAEHAPCSVYLACGYCGPTCDALHPHAVGRGATTPTPRPIGGVQFDRS